MNTNTGMIRDMQELTEEERQSPEWVPVSDDVARAALALDLHGAVDRLKTAEARARERQLEGLRKPGRR